MKYIPAYRWPLFYLLLISFLLPFLPTQAQYANSLYEQTSEVHPLMLQLRADEGSLGRFYFMTNSPERTTRFQQLYKDYLQQLDKLNFENLNTGARVDYLLFKRDLENKLHSLEVTTTEYNQIAKWIPFAESIYALEKPRRRGAIVNGQQVADQLNALTKTIQTSTAALEKEASLNRDLAFRLQSTIKDLQEGLKSVYSFYNEYDPNFTWWVPGPYKQVDDLLTAYATLAEKKGKVPDKKQNKIKVA